VFSLGTTSTIRTFAALEEGYRGSDSRFSLDAAANYEGDTGGMAPHRVVSTTTTTPLPRIVSVAPGLAAQPSPVSPRPGERASTWQSVVPSVMPIVNPRLVTQGGNDVEDRRGRSFVFAPSVTAPHDGEDDPAVQALFDGGRLVPCRQQQRTATALRLEPWGAPFLSVFRLVRSTAPPHKPCLESSRWAERSVREEKEPFPIEPVRWRCASGGSSGIRVRLGPIDRSDSRTHAPPHLTSRDAYKEALFVSRRASGDPVPTGAFPR
jgi:hypothetical protein